MLYILLYLKCPQEKQQLWEGIWGREGSTAGFVGFSSVAFLLSPTASVDLGFFSGRMMERPGTLKADNKDLNLASAILTAKPVFLCRMGTIRHLDGKLVSMD